MHNVKFLEREWSKLNLKRFMFRFGVVIFAILIVVAIITLIFSNIDFGSDSDSNVEKLKNIQNIETPPQKLESIAKLEDKIIIDEPKIEEDIQEEIIQEPTYEPPSYTNIIEEEEKIIDLKNKTHSNIARSTNTQDFVTTLKDKYNKDPDYITAIQIAEEELKKNSYNEALNWSIKANELDDSKDESWLIFANAKVKLNKYSEAINALKVYLSKKSSNRVEELLEKLEKEIKIQEQKTEIKETKIEKTEKNIDKIFDKKETQEELLTKIKILKKSYYAYPTAKDALMLTKSYIKLNNYKNCTFWAEKLIKILPNDESGYLYYGTCGLEVRYLSKSINKLREYLKNHKSEKVESLIRKLEDAKRD